MKELQLMNKTKSGLGSSICMMPVLGWTVMVCGRFKVGIQKECKPIYCSGQRQNCRDTSVDNLFVLVVKVYWTEHFIPREPAGLLRSLSKDLLRCPCLLSRNRWQSRIGPFLWCLLLTLQNFIHSPNGCHPSLSFGCQLKTVLFFWSIW